MHFANKGIPSFQFAQLSSQTKKNCLKTYKGLHMLLRTLQTSCSSPLVCIPTLLNLWDHIYIFSQICLGYIKNLITFLVPNLETNLQFLDIHQKCRAHHWDGNHFAQRDTNFCLCMGFDFQLVQPRHVRHLMLKLYKFGYLVKP